ncbi:hypothetical protein AUC43_10320 [Hymenobacter sedentarius]|uniref:Chemoreceptor zinc-binding domain-containing protein n=1 Tax=Hymenobacter sedentarius TaxID=1411621 RepID=A0A0U3JYN7_9BACT|nr:CZB domain-containing protein [Hymenobacter sedentarius]ALW85455.1 hypothetical protein AUC43_10320 [Hymenobacter sedentarius]
MNSQELKQDFESARIRHVHFKSRLRSFLFGNGGDEELLRDPELCSLGQWITSQLRGSGPYAHLPEARRFDQEHVRMHREASRLIDLYQAGRADEALTGFGPLQELADEMVGLLQTMEAKLRTEA